MLRISTLLGPTGRSTFPVVESCREIVEMTQANRTVKRTLGLLFASVLIGSLTGCPGSSPTSPTSTTSSSNSSSARAITNITTNFYTHVGDLGIAGPGNADGQFRAPYDVEIAADGAIYTVDRSYLNCRVQKFSSSGTFLAKWGTYGNISSSGQFDSPIRLTTDNTGSLYILELMLARTVRYTTNGVYTLNIPNFVPTVGSAQYTVQPTGLWVTGTNVFMIEYLGGHKIQRYDHLGNWITNWTGTNMPGGGHFTYPSFLVSNGSSFYVHAGGTAIRRFGGDMNYLGDLTLSADPGGSKEMIFGAGGDFFISSSSQISKYNASGTLLGKWSRAGTNQFKSIEGIALDATGRVYAADSQASRVYIFAPISSTVTNIETY